MKLTYSEKKLIVAIVAQELADIDPRNLKADEWAIDILPNAARKLAYWLGQEVTTLCLDEAQEALSDLVKLDKAVTEDDLWELLGAVVYPNEALEDTIYRLEDYFDTQYETAVINIIGAESN